MGERRAQTFSLVLRLVCIVAAIGVLTWLVVTRRHELVGLTEIGVDAIALVAAISLVCYVINGIAFRLVVAPFGVQLSLTDATLLQLAVYTLNHLPMKGGTVLQGLIMRARHGVRLTDFVSFSAASQFASVWALLIFGSVALFGVGGHAGIAAIMMVAPLLGLAMLLVLARLQRRSATSPGRWTRAARAVIDGLGQLFGNPRLVASLLALNILIAVLQAVRLYVIFAALGAPVTALGAAVVAALGSIAYTFSFAPAGLGFREGGLAAGTTALGLRGTVGLAVALVDRAVDLAIVILVGVPATLYLTRTTPDVSTETQP